jgi:hypothetical protein
VLLRRALRYTAVGGQRVAADQAIMAPEVASAPVSSASRLILGRRASEESVESSEESSE